MATAKAIQPTQAEWDARAIELAEAQHLTGTARLLAENELRSFYGVRMSGPVGEYMVRVEWWRTGEVRRITCDCLAGAHGKACKRAGMWGRCCTRSGSASGPSASRTRIPWRAGAVVSPGRRLLSAALSARRARSDEEATHHVLGCLRRYDDAVPLAPTGARHV